jgi:hypothetical protein
MPFVTPGGRGSYTRPHLQLIYAPPCATRARGGCTRPTTPSASTASSTSSAWAPSGGSTDTYGHGNDAHLDELLADAETRAHALGADALVVRDVRTVARYVPRTEYRPCGRGFGLRGGGMFTCPVLVSSLEIDMHLRVAAVRRGEASDVAPPWRATPSLAPAPWGAPRAP